MPRARTGTAIFPRWVDITMPKRMEKVATDVLNFVDGDDATLREFARAALIQGGEPQPTDPAITAEANAMKALLTQGLTENAGAPTAPPLPGADPGWVARRWAGSFVQAMQKFASILLDEDSSGTWNQSTEAVDVLKVYVANSTETKSATDLAKEIAADYNAYAQQKVGAAALWLP